MATSYADRYSKMPSVDLATFYRLLDGDAAHQPPKRLSIFMGYPDDIPKVLVYVAGTAKEGS